MKSVFLHKLVLVGVLVALVLLPIACSTAHLGETKAEARRRIRRNDRINWSELAADWDAFWLRDEPSRLTDKRIP